MRPQLLIHGLAASLLVCVSGCGNNEADAATGAAQAGQQAAGTQHVHAPPHGGVLVELVADSASIEVVVDATLGRLDLYLLGPHLAQYVPVAQESIGLRLLVGADSFEIEAAAQANPLTGETVGRTSHFVAQDERLPGVQRFDGVIEEVTMFQQTFTDKRFSWSAEPVK